MASSEHSLDDNTEAPVTEAPVTEAPAAVEPPFDCTGLPHLHDCLEHYDYHQRPGSGPDSGYWACEEALCKKRWSGPFVHGTDWGGIPVSHWQETDEFSVFASSSFFEGSAPEPQHLASLPEFGSPSIPGSRAFSPTPEVSPVHLSPSFVPTTLPSDLSNLFEEDDVEELLAPSQEEEEATPLSPDLVFVLQGLPPAVSEEEVSDDFFEFYLLSTMSDMKADHVSVLKRSSDYKVWSSQMLGYLTFIEAEDALRKGDLKDADYKKANARAKGVILMRTDNSFHHLLYEKVNGEEVMKSAKDMWASLKTHFGTPDAAFVWSQFSSLI